MLWAVMVNETGLDDEVQMWMKNLLGVPGTGTIFAVPGGGAKIIGRHAGIPRSPADWNSRNPKKVV